MPAPSALTITTEPQVMTAAEVMALIRASEKRFYCYVLRRPDGRPFYIGAGSGKRVLEHERDARTTRRGYKRSLIRRILKDGEKVNYWIAGLFDTWEEACEEERQLIALYGRADTGKGPLTNRTDGGEGIVGIVWVFTDARKAGAKRAAEKNRGRPLTEEHKARLSEVGRGRPQSAQHVVRRMAGRKGKPLSPEQVAKMSEAGKRRNDLASFIEGGRRWREANMDKLIEERRSRWRDPAKRQRITKANIKARGRPIVINDVWHPTITAAASVLGVTRWTIYCLIAERRPGCYCPDDT